MFLFFFILCETKFKSGVGVVIGISFYDLMKNLTNLSDICPLVFPVVVLSVSYVVGLFIWKNYGSV